MRKSAGMGCDERRRGDCAPACSVVAVSAEVLGSYGLLKSIPPVLPDGLDAPEGW